jgi:hypothetical protein
MAASSLAKQVQELRKLIEARNAKRGGPVYLRAGVDIPDGVDSERVIFIQRVLIDPPELAAEQLPEVVEPSPAIERASPQSFNRPQAKPELGIVWEANSVLNSSRKLEYADPASFV